MRRRDSGEPDPVPAGCLAAVDGATAGAAVLEPGPLGARLEVVGLALAELPSGTWLRIGAATLLALQDGGATAPAGGVAEVAEAGGEGARGAARPAVVVAGGIVRAGDPVAIEAVAVPVGDALDLHMFGPADVPAVVEAYLAEAHAAGFRRVRLIHGRGRGVQRAVVRRLLARSCLVAAFSDAPSEAGGWGATVVELRCEPGGGP